jgi:pimeloyl-ACP methyl ester carboxylesterase
MYGWKIPVAVTAGVLALVGGLATTAAAQPAQVSTAKPTVVLVSGAFEDSSSWNGVISRLQRDGYPVIAPAVPLRGVATDSAYVSAIVRNINGPVVLAGHSYGGLITTEVAAQNPKQVKALVYPAAFIPQAGDTGAQLVGQFPGSLLGPDTTYTVGGPPAVRRRPLRR